MSYTESYTANPQVSDKQVKSVVGWVIEGIIGFFALMLILSSFTVVGAGERGVLVRLGSVQDTILGEGFHLKNPITDVQKVTVKTQTIQLEAYTNKWDDKFDYRMLAASRDLQDVTISAVVNYHQDATKVNKIYQEYGPTYQENVIEPIIKEVVKSTASQYTAEELVTKRIEFSEKVNQILKDRIGQKGAFLETFSVTNFQFSDSFNKAIEAKVTAEQDALAAKNKLEQVKFEAEQRVTTAKAEAEAIRIQAQAITQQGGAEYVNLKAVEKWSGILPTTMVPNGGLPFLNIR